MYQMEIWKRGGGMDPFLSSPRLGSTSSMSNEAMMDQVKQYLAQKYPEEFLWVRFFVSNSLIAVEYFSPLLL